MARSARIVSESGMYHVLLRSKEKIFFSKADYIKFIEIMKDCFSEYGGLLGYCLMDNHIHMVIMDKKGKLSTIIRIMTTKYSRYKQESVFYDRFKCESIESDEDLAHLMYFLAKHTVLTDEDELYASFVDNMCEKCEYDKDGLENRIGNIQSDNLRMFMDDYTNMSKKDIKKFITLLTGIEADKIKKLDTDERYECLLKIRKDNWLSSRKLAQILGICRNNFTYKDDENNPEKAQIEPKKENNPKKSQIEPKEENNPKETQIQPKEEKKLDVWLL